MIYRLLHYIALAFCLFALLIWGAARPGLRKVGRMFSVHNAEPSRIHVGPAERVIWEFPRKVEDYSTQFRRLGYRDTGLYVVREMPHIPIRLFLGTHNNTYAVVCEHPAIDAWVDVCKTLGDGTMITVSNCPTSGFLDNPKIIEKYPMRNATVEELVKKAEAVHPDEPCLPVSRDGFIKSMQEEYAINKEWRRARGGMTNEEIRRIANWQKTTVTLVQMEQVKRAAKLRELKQQRKEELESSATARETRPAEHAGND